MHVMTCGCSPLNLHLQDRWSRSGLGAVVHSPDLRNGGHPNGCGGIGASRAGGGLALAGGQAGLPLGSGPWGAQTISAHKP